MAEQDFDFRYDTTRQTTRRTTLTRAMKRHPIAMVSRMAGHTSIAITVDRYVPLAAEDLCGQWTTRRLRLARATLAILLDQLLASSL